MMWGDGRFLSVCVSHRSLSVLSMFISLNHCRTQKKKKQLMWHCGLGASTRVHTRPRLRLKDEERTGRHLLCVSLLFRRTSSSRVRALFSGTTSSALRSGSLNRLTHFLKQEGKSACARVCVGVLSAGKQGFPQCRACLLSRSGVVTSRLPLLP